MSRLLAAFLLLSALASSTFAQKPSDNAPSDTATAMVSAASKDYPDESYVIEQSRTLYRFENDGTGRKETIARVRVQSEAGVEQWGQHVFGYNSANEKVEISYVRVRKEDGTVVTTPEDAVQDLTAPVEREA